MFISILLVARYECITKITNVKGMRKSVYVVLSKLKLSIFWCLYSLYVVSTRENRAINLNETDDLILTIYT